MNLGLIYGKMCFVAYASFMESAVKRKTPLEMVLFWLSGQTGLKNQCNTAF